MGFYNSIGNTQDKYFVEFANYDVIVDVDLMPIMIEHPASEYMDESQKALVMHVDIQDESYMLAIVESGFDMVNVPANELLNGVIIPEYFANQWGVVVGDMLNINEYSVIISAVVPQHLGLMLYTGFDYINQITNDVPAIYNTLYGRTDDMAGLRAYLKDNNITFSTVEDDKTSFESIMESMSVLIWFMIACAVVLGLTVLYSVGLINLSAREYEYMFMGVMGYPHKSIMTAHIKETILQLILAIPLGFVLGNILLEIIKGEFSGSNFVVASAIYPQSYILAAAAVVGITAVMALVTSKHINRLDIVEGLKAQDD
jgi:putative ABC transport system permease protein